MTETLGVWERPGAGPSPQGDDLARPGAQPEGFPNRVVLIYHMLTRLLVGFVGAAGSPLFHVVGSLCVHRHPLEIIRVYLTFPFGEQALRLDTGPLLATD